jgi:hypothetical protein
MATFTSIKKYLDDLVKIHIINMKDILLKDRELVDWCIDNLYFVMNTTIPSIENKQNTIENKPFAYTGIGHNVSFGTLAASTTNISGTLTVSGMIYGTAQHALYSDLAECYKSKIDYPLGTLVSISEAEDIDHEIDPTTEDNILNYLGIVSTNPAITMNIPSLEIDQDVTTFDIHETISTKIQSDVYNIPIGLIGRVPVLINGPIKKGQHFTVDTNNAGIGIASDSYPSLGIALATKTSNDIGSVLCMIK